MMRSVALKFHSAIQHIGFVADLRAASERNWHEAIKEVFIVLFFSLMPLWLGLILVTISSIAGGILDFVDRFASSSDLGILSASLLGPVLYMIFNEASELTGNRALPRFPSGLWFVLIVIGCCVTATGIYSFTYLSENSSFFDNYGDVIRFVDTKWVSILSWVLFVVSVSLVLFAATIRNSLDSQTVPRMRNDTDDFVAQMEDAQQEEPQPPEGDDTEDFTRRLRDAADEAS